MLKVIYTKLMVVKASKIYLSFIGMVKRKVLVLDLDETLIHSHHEGVLRHPSKPEMPPDFILKVTIERHPVRFYVHKRPHVDFFLDVVSFYILKYALNTFKLNCILLHVTKFRSLNGMSW